MTPEWTKTQDEMPPEDVLVLGDDLTSVFLVTFSGNSTWRYSEFDSNVAPIFWCRIPKRIRKP